MAHKNKKTEKVFAELVKAVHRGISLGFGRDKARAALPKKAKGT